MIEDINIKNIDIGNIQPRNIGLPPPVIPTIPHATTQIGTPILQLPGCVETHKDSSGNKNLAQDDPNGIVIHCDGSVPSYRPLDYNPEELIPIRPTGIPKTPTENREEESLQPPEAPIPSSIPGTTVEGGQDKPKGKQEVCEWYGTLLSDDPRCIQPTFIEKYLPPAEMVSTTATIAAVATTTAIFAKPVADVLLKVVKPTIKKVIKKIAAIRGKKITVLSVKDRRDEQRLRNHAIRKLKGKE